MGLWPAVVLLAFLCLSTAAGMLYIFATYKFYIAMYFKLIIYNYHHSTKLYWKIAQVCCRLYCYKCTARVQPGSMVTKILSQTFDFITCSDTSVWLAVPDMYSRVICSTDTNSRVTCSIKNTAFYKLHTAARLPH